MACSLLTLRCSLIVFKSGGGTGGGFGRKSCSEGTGRAGDCGGDEGNFGGRAMCGTAYSPLCPRMSGMSANQKICGGGKMKGKFGTCSWAGVGRYPWFVWFPVSRHSRIHVHCSVLVYVEWLVVDGGLFFGVLQTHLSIEASFTVYL